MKPIKSLILLTLLILSQQTLTINRKYFFAPLITLQLLTSSQGIGMLPDQPPVLLPKLERELEEAKLYRSNFLRGFHFPLEHTQEEHQDKSYASALSPQISTPIILSSLLALGIYL